MIRKEGPMVFIFVLLILLALLLAVSYGVYRYVLYAPVGRQNEPHHLPTGEQYDPWMDEMHRFIDELLALPHERVHIRYGSTRHNDLSAPEMRDSPSRQKESWSSRDRLSPFLAIPLC